MKGSPPIPIDRLGRGDLRALVPRESRGLAGVSRHAIRGWRLLLLGALGLVVLAAMAWKRIPRLEDPLVEAPRVLVTIPYPGASAEDVEAQVLRPIEQDIFGMDGVTLVESRAYTSYAVVKVEFTSDTKMDAVAEAVRGKVLGARARMPARVGEPVVTRSKVATFLTNMVVIVAGHRSDAVLDETARRLEDALVTVPGVATVTRRGARAHAVRVRLDPIRLAQNHLTVAEVGERIRASNVRVPGGELPVGSIMALLSVTQELGDAAAVGRVPVGAMRDNAGGSHTVTLADVAEVRDDFVAGGERMMHDGGPAVGLEVRFRPGENGLVVGDRVRAQLAAARGTLPAGVRIEVAHDQPEWVRRSLSHFSESLVEGVLLVMLVLTFGMGWRAASVVAIVLPLAIAGAVFGLYVFGFALDQVSIAGLIVALGLLVDDAVVVTESVQRMRDAGLSATRSAVLGTARVFWANNGTTAVACASFVPLFFLGGEIGAFMRGLPLAVVLALVTSLLVAQLLTPWISTFFLRVPPGVRAIADAAPFDRRDDAHHEERNPGLRAIRALYTWTLGHVLRRPLVVIGAAVFLLVGSLLLLPKIGVAFFQKADKPLLFVGIELPRGASAARTAEKVAAVVRELQRDLSVASTSAVVGGAYPVVFLGRAVHPPAQDYGEVLVRLDCASTDALTRRIRGRLASIPGIRATVSELYNGPPVPHPIVIRIEGDDYRELQTYADRVKADLRAIAGTVNVTDSMSESVPVATVAVDSDLAFRHGVTPAQVGAALRAVHGEDAVTELRSDRDPVEVVFERIDEGEPLALVGETPIPTAGGRSVPLAAVGQVALGASRSQLARRNTRRIVEVSADLDGGTLAAAVLAQMKPRLDAIPFAKGYGYAFGGDKEKTERSFKDLALAGVGTLVVIFVVLVVMARSLTTAVIVLAAVPFALIGAIPGLYVTGNPFGFMAFLGVVALIGVYVNHKIYFVDRTQELLARGMDLPSAMRQAGLDRIRPVVLTALTAIVGLLPLTLDGGSLWAGFGWVNVFGLAASIPLSLVLLPALLVVGLRIRDRLAPRASAPVVSLPDRTVVPLAPVRRVATRR